MVDRHAWRRTLAGALVARDRLVASGFDPGDGHPTATDVDDER